MSSVENQTNNNFSTKTSTPVGKNIENVQQQNEIDPDDPCLKKEEEVKKEPKIFKATVGLDPRFQQQNQTLRCFVSYVDFFRCEKILGEGHEACEWFKESYNTFCPLKWIEDFDEARKEGRFPWHRRDQGKFPGYKYG
ncbi:uncharacterized protein LOC127284671 [Leptopilina boulardi]|uniref:uncharacterized protein LOC127284671 n=1 Tax=Leptopilina boulardi TaxID=63433 RepID=UPI0021F663FE|nr:uncharacterized protein LOC127284671 [Leptopilina boulardi]